MARPRSGHLVAALAVGLVLLTARTGDLTCANPSPPLQRRGVLLTAGAALPGRAVSAAAPSERVPVAAAGRISGAAALPLTVGLGTCLVSPAAVVDQVTTAIQAGYRLIDTAQRYGNEFGVGTALNGVFRGGLPRDEVFVTTKVWPANYGFDKTIQSVKASSDQLGLKAIDLVLPHWPGVSTSADYASENFRLRKETWQALETLKDEGVVKQIGVSNYNSRHLGELLGYAKVKPMASQFEVHPFNTRAQLVALCQEEGICVNSYSPLGGKGNPGAVTDQLLKSPVLKAIAQEHSKTPAQVILRWHLQRGITPIPKASSKQRIEENFSVFDFSLSAEEMGQISALDRGKFAVMDSEVFL